MYVKIGSAYLRLTRNEDILFHLWQLLKVACCAHVCVSACVSSEMWTHVRMSSMNSYRYRQRLFCSVTFTRALFYVGDMSRLSLLDGVLSRWPGKGLNVSLEELQEAVPGLKGRICCEAAEARCRAILSKLKQRWQTAGRKRGRMVTDNHLAFQTIWSCLL